MPSEYQTLDTRGIVKLSTKVKIANDRKGTKAGRVAARMNATLEAYWRALSENKSTEARQAYADAVRLARSLGFEYQTALAGAEKPIAEILTRIETLVVGERWKDRASRAGHGPYQPAYPSKVVAHCGCG